MKDKLRTLIRGLAQKHYSIDMIERCILLPMQPKDKNQKEELMDKLILAVQQTNSEMELLEEIHKLENQYMNNNCH